MFFLIDKPLGVSSFFVAKKLKKLLGTKKVGYLGTLDPLATGCLLFASDKSTKMLHLLEKSEKTYLFTVDISGRTASYDAGTPREEVSMDSFIQKNPIELRNFLLAQNEQIPPVYSAIHVGGMRAYQLARNNQTIQLESRKIYVPLVEIIEFSPPVFTLRMRISSGGYIRSFAPLIGKFFGVDGGYVSVLRRETLHLPGGDISLSQAQGIDDFSSTDSIAYEVLFPHLPIEPISNQEYQDLLQGKEISAWEKQYDDGQNLLLRFENKFMSLVVFRDNRFQIVRNDV